MLFRTAPKLGTIFFYEISCQVSKGSKSTEQFYLIMKAKVCWIGLQRLSYFDNPFDGFTPGVGFKG